MGKLNRYIIFNKKKFGISFIAIGFFLFFISFLKLTFFNEIMLTILWFVLVIFIVAGLSLYAMHVLERNIYGTIYVKNIQISSLKNFKSKSRKYDFILFIILLIPLLLFIYTLLLEFPYYEVLVFYVLYIPIFLKIIGKK